MKLLGEPLASQIVAFCAASPGKPSEIGVVRDAVAAFIKKQIESNRDLRQRYESALKAQREGNEGGNVVVLQTKR